jgi:phospholipase D1/2
MAPSARKWIPLLVAALALAMIWWLTPLRSMLDAHRVAALGRQLRTAPSAPLIAVAAYVVGGPVLFPLTPLLAATALVFPPVWAFGIAVTGTSLAAAETFAIGRIVRARDVRWLHRPRIERLRARLQGRGAGVLAMAGARLVPFGNFALINIAAGAIGIRFGHFMLGNLLGVLPGILVLTVLASWIAPK